jgi:hypothetical protein
MSDRALCCGAQFPLFFSPGTNQNVFAPLTASSTE